MEPLKPVLVAEDNPVMQSVLRAMLSWWRFSPVIVADGAEAWRILQSEDAPRLAIVDWLMPGMDGLELCRRVRSSENGDYTYLVLLTARDHSADVVAGLDAGADDYLTKPFNAHELRARLRAGSRIVQLQQDLLLSRTELRDARNADGLTGVLNRAAILRTLESELAAGRTVAVLLAGIDRMRHINSSFGHPAGDAVLAEFGRRLRSAIPEALAVGRYSGGEFLILLADSEGASPAQCADLLRQTAARRPFTCGAASFPVTCNIGVSSGRRAPADALLRAAEDALALAKRESRERLAETLLNRGAAVLRIPS